MKKLSVLMSVAVTALLMLLGSCMSPVSSLTIGGAAQPALGAKDVRLVFNTSDNRAAAAAGATFLTVQLESVVDGTVKFASATGAGGIYTVTVGGMVGGEWKLRARFWDTEANKALMYYANTRETLVPGQAKTVALTVYPVASIGQVDVIDAKMPHHVTVLGQDGQSSTATDKKLPVGSTWALDGITYWDAGETTPASTPGVLWSSNKENIAVVSTSGKVTVLGIGSAIITATSVIDPAYTAIYKIEGVSPVFGSWKVTSNDMMGWRSQVYRYDNSNFTAYMWDSEGDLEVIRGPYTINGNLLSMKPNQALDITLPTPAWAPVVNGQYEDWIASVEVMGNALVMTPLFTGPKSVLSRVNVSPMSYSLVFNKVDEKKVTGVTIDSQVANFSMYPGSRLYTLGVQTSPIDATVGGVIWKTDTVAVLGPMGTRDNNFLASTPGTAVLTAYALDSDFDIPTPPALSTLTASVVINTPPLVTMNTSPYTSTPGSASFNFDVTDSSGLKSINWSVKEMINGNVMGNGTVTNVTGTAANFNVDVSTFALSEGHYQIQVTAVDTQGMGSYTPQMSDFWVDTMAPSIVSEDLSTPAVAIGIDSMFTITFTDTTIGSGVADASFQITDNIAALSLSDGSMTTPLTCAVLGLIQTGNTGTFTLDLSVFDPMVYVSGAGSIEVKITDKAGHTTTQTITFTLWVPPPT